jgi:hypothetical protein
MSSLRRWKRPLPLAGAAVLGVIVVLAAQQTAPLVETIALGNDFKQSYIDCALARQHARYFGQLHLDSALRSRVDKTVAIEQLRCMDYQELRLRLLASNVSEVKVALMEVDAANGDPNVLDYEARH